MAVLEYYVALNPKNHFLNYHKMIKLQQVHKVLEEYICHSEALGRKSTYHNQFLIRLTVLEALTAQNLEEYSFYFKRELNTSEGKIDIFEVELPSPPKTLKEWNDIDGVDTVFLDNSVDWTTFIQSYYDISEMNNDPFLDPTLIEKETDKMFEDALASDTDRDS